MRKFLTSSVLVLSLAAGGAAMATPKPATHAAPATASKASDCAKQWKGQTKHAQTRKVFMAACAKA